MTTLPPLFPVELSKERLEPVSRGNLSSKGAEVPHAKNHTLLMGGLAGLEGRFFMWVQPHNCRLYFDFSRKGFSILGAAATLTSGNEGSGLLFPMEVKALNNGAELFIRFKDFQIKIKKSQVEVLNLLEHKKLYPVDLRLAGEAQAEVIEEVKKQKEAEGLDFLKQFIQRFGGTSEFKVLRNMTEIKHFDSRLEPLLPKGKVWHNKTGKRVYPDQLVYETHGWAYSANLLKNMALFDFAPFLAEELRLIKERLPVQAEQPQAEIKVSQGGLESSTQGVPLNASEMAVLKARIKDVPSFLRCQAEILQLPEGAREELKLWFWYDLIPSLASDLRNPEVASSAA